MPSSDRLHLRGVNHSSGWEQPTLPNLGAGQEECGSEDAEGDLDGGRFPIPEIWGETDGKETVKLAGSHILLQYITFMVTVSCGFCGIP
jgi:hypothetical protein